MTDLEIAKTLKDAAQYIRLRSALMGTSRPLRGGEGGSYYVSERKLTIENAQAIVRCAPQVLVDFRDDRRTKAYCLEHGHRVTAAVTSEGHYSIETVRVLAHA